jgi:hypothetical protein
MIKIGLVLATVLIITSLTVEVYAINITAFIHFNEQAIKEDSYGGDLDDVRFTVDGNYSGTYYDMIDAAYGDSNEPDYIDEPIEKELMVSDNAS